ncbi:MAG: hypothetical protein KDK97_07495, partial [Verrucomicrobiales bacterium]|nr:hypothetical protein [Verrucomicrobiales bacterium]
LYWSRSWRGTWGRLRRSLIGVPNATGLTEPSYTEPGTKTFLCHPHLDDEGRGRPTHSAPRIPALKRLSSPAELFSLTHSP